MLKTEDTELQDLITWQRCPQMSCQTCGKWLVKTDVTDPLLVIEGWLLFCFGLIAEAP